MTEPRRSRLLLAAIYLIGAVFVIRLFYLQVVQHDYYETQAIKEHVTKFTIPAKRGEIYALDGNGDNRYVPLVLNQAVYTAYADPRYVKNPDHTVVTLQHLAGGNVVDKFEDNLKDTSKQYVVLARGLSKQQADLIKKEKLSGVGLQEGEQRVYPEGQLAAQVLGFVNGEGKGQYGIEQGANDLLSGTDGLLKSATDVRGIPLSIGPESVQIEARNGKNLVLSIDRTVQYKTEQVLKAGLEHAGATKGSIIVVDPNNGHIMAMANLPTYNPNDYKKVTDYGVFQNRALSDPYEPGSVIKSLTMAAGLNEGIIQPTTTYNNLGYVDIAGTRIKNALRNPLGTLNMTQVLQFSFNTGAVFVLQQMGGGEVNKVARQTLYNYFDDHYYFGHPTGIELAGDVSGKVIPPDDAQGGPVRYANMTFGQGMNIDMVQVAMAFSAAVNGGTYYTPQVIDGYLSDKGVFSAKAPTIRKSGVISADASAKLRQMLHDARTHSSASKGDKPGYLLGGKTGTAQVYDPKTGDYSETATIGSYLGFGGQDKPQYVIMVRVDDATNGGFSGSAAAAPIFTELSNWMLGYLQIQPRG